MKFRLLIILISLSLIHLAYAQGEIDVLVIDSSYNVDLPKEKGIREIVIKRGLLKQTKKQLIQQCIDSTLQNNGNCFKIDYIDESEALVIGKKNGKPDYIRGSIFKLTLDEIDKLRSVISHQKSTNPNQKKVSTALMNDSSGVVYEGDLIFQFGGESKLTLLPKFRMVRKHIGHLIEPYYGAEVGYHPLFISNAFTFTGLAGIEMGIFSIESSVSHFRTTKFRNGAQELKGPVSQNLINAKIGFRIKKFRLVASTSFLINEHIPLGTDRIGLLDIGKINGQIFGLELQINMF